MPFEFGLYRYESQLLSINQKICGQPPEIDRALECHQNLSLLGDRWVTGKKLAQRVSYGSSRHADCFGFWQLLASVELQLALSRQNLSH